ncbi:HugZ family protein [Mesorhizobium sp. VNQ89]|uniref:HugZ family pyridoxamine 5'-phosphate oxidase n=1 Tax=Mesorhizobium quangtriensis TaxID=3157709 RepID=UPI0032B76573
MNDQPKDVIRETDAEAIRLAKTLVRVARFGALAALDAETGAPIASRVGVATDADGTPLILVSGLAAHTRAILADPRCSLLVGEPGKGDPLAHPRITLQCRAVRLECETPERTRAEWRYLSRNPKAKLYVGLGDFSFFRLEVERASLNGGFGKAYALKREDIVLDSPVVEELAAAEQRAVDHMNDDHLDAIANFARHFAKVDSAGWVMTGLDIDGFDIVAGDEARRIFFPSPLKDAREMREILVAMAKEAREAVQP